MRDEQPLETLVHSALDTMIARFEKQKLARETVLSVLLR